MVRIIFSLDSKPFVGVVYGWWSPRQGMDMIILGILNLMIQLFFCILLMTLDLADTGKEAALQRHLSLPEEALELKNLSKVIWILYVRWFEEGLKGGIL